MCTSIWSLSPSLSNYLLREREGIGSGGRARGPPRPHRRHGRATERHRAAHVRLDDRRHQLAHRSHTTIVDTQAIWLLNGGWTQALNTRLYFCTTWLSYRRSDLYRLSWCDIRVNIIAKPPLVTFSIPYVNIKYHGSLQTCYNYVTAGLRGTSVLKIS